MHSFSSKIGILMKERMHSSVRFKAMVFVLADDYSTNTAVPLAVTINMLPLLPTVS